MKTALSLCLLAALGAARAVQADPVAASDPAADSLDALMSWAVKLSGYPREPVPPLEYRPHSFFVEHACGGRECAVIGWYNDGGTVYIDERQRDNRALIVHEFVHVLQHVSGHYDSSSCQDSIDREREAYRVQSQYMIENGNLQTPNLVHEGCSY
jgi:hypothetical protein